MHVTIICMHTLWMWFIWQIHTYVKCVRDAMQCNAMQYNGIAFSEALLPFNLIQTDRISLSFSCFRNLQLYLVLRKHLAYSTFIFFFFHFFFVSVDFYFGFAHFVDIHLVFVCRKVCFISHSIYHETFVNWIKIKQATKSRVKRARAPLKMEMEQLQ